MLNKVFMANMLIIAENKAAEIFVKEGLDNLTLTVTWKVMETMESD